MAGLTKRQLEEQVKVTCYRETETMKRRDAIAYYQEGMLSCDPGSSECERYTTIFCQLLEGRMVCSDEC